MHIDIIYLQQLIFDVNHKIKYGSRKQNEYWNRGSRSKKGGVKFWIEVRQYDGAIIYEN